jgi:hypothetical protein
MRRLIVAVLAALTLGACAPSVPLAGAQADAEGKQFQPPSAGSAAAYFYVSRAGDSFAVLSGKRHLGTIGSNAWIRADLPAGSHDLGCAIDGFAFMTSPAARNDPRGNWSGETHRTFDLASRQTYFFEIGVTAAPGSITCTIAEVAASHGRTKIMERSRAIEVR